MIYILLGQARFNSKVVVIDRCDKNFVYYWTNDRTFPRVSILVLNSHPCEPKVIRWLEKCANKPGTQIYVTAHWQSYIKRWGDNDSNIIRVISNEDYEKILPVGVRN